jgi:type VI secretion system protein ImpC
MSSAAQQAAGASAAAESFDGSQWLDQATKKMRVGSDAEARKRGVDAIQQFIENAMQPGQVLQKDVETNIKFWINAIDQKLSTQLNEIMHNAAFQKLEGTWRGLHYLVNQTETGDSLKIRVLNATKQELIKDLESAVEFDMSELFKKIYEEEYGTLGGHPFGMLMGDYEFNVKRSQDVKLLQGLAGIAAASHAPFVSAGDPDTFNLDSFADLGKHRDLAKIFQSVEFAPWQSFRESEDSRYVALTLPRVLSRLPYGQKFQPVAEFNFEEDVDGTNHEKYLWMNSSWAYASRITDSFSKHGWMARTRGVEGGGKVEGLPVHTFRTDEGDVAMKCPTEVAITDRRENELSNLGFMPLIHCKNRDFAAFMGAQSCQKPVKYDRPGASANAELSAKFNLLMCVSRFAHFLKVMVRNRIGSFMERDDMERWLNRWIKNYCIANPSGVSDEEKAKFPLQTAEIKVQEVPGQPGMYRAVAHLRPHFQLEGLDISLRMVAKQLSQG